MTEPFYSETGIAVIGATCARGTDWTPPSSHGFGFSVLRVRLSNTMPPGLYIK